MYLSKTVCLVTLWVLILGRARGQHKAFTLQECLQYTLGNSHHLKKAKLDEVLGTEKVRAARAQVLPQLSGSGKLIDNIKRPVILVPGTFMKRSEEVVPVSISPIYNANLEVNIQQQLFNQSVFTALKAAKAAREFYRLQSQLSEEQVIEQVATTYYQLQISSLQLELANSNLGTMDSLFQVTQGQYRNGLAKKIDLDHISVKKANLVTQKMQLENAIEGQKSQLKHIMGMSLSEQLSIAHVDLEKPESLESSRFDLNKITPYHVLKLQERLLELDKKNSQAAYYPILSVFGQYAYNGISNQFDFFKAKGTSVWRGVASIGLTIQVPIFDGLAKRARLSQSSIQLQQIKEEIADHELALNLAHHTARLNLQNSWNVMQYQDQNKQLAHEVYQSVSHNYHYGLATLSDLLDAASSLKEAQNHYVQSLLQYKQATIKLMKASGNIQSLLN